MAIDPSRERAERYLRSYRDQLDQFSAIEDYSQLPPAEEPSLSTALVADTEVKGLLRALRETDVDTTEWESEYAMCRREMEELLRSPDVRRYAVAELEYLLDSFPAKVSHFLELEPLQMEVEQHLGWRDSIEALLTELDTSESIDVREQRIRLEALDEVLRVRYEEGIETIRSECPTVERPYYPESFWWRHPSRVANERDSVE